MNRSLLVALAAASLTACAGPATNGTGVPPSTFYRCDAQFTFWVRFMDGTAVVDSGQGREVLVPAGSSPRSDIGASPNAGVQRFANRRVAIDFFREPNNTGQLIDKALVRFTDAAFSVRCVRDD